MNDEQFLVLNCIYLRKLVPTAAVVECTALSRDAVDRALAAVTGDGAALDVGDGQYMLTEDGTQQVLAEYGQRYAAERQDAFFTDWYDRFEVLNGQFLAGISAWQREDVLVELEPDVVDILTLLGRPRDVAEA